LIGLQWGDQEVGVGFWNDSAALEMQLEGTPREIRASVSVKEQHQLREIYDGQRRVSLFLVPERSEGEQHGQWEGR